MFVLSNSSLPTTTKTRRATPVLRIKSANLAPAAKLSAGDVDDEDTPLGHPIAAGLLYRFHPGFTYTLVSAPQPVNNEIDVVVPGMSWQGSDGIWLADAGLAMKTGSVVLGLDVTRPVPDPVGEIYSLNVAGVDGVVLGVSAAGLNFETPGTGLMQFQRVGDDLLLYGDTSTRIPAGERAVIQIALSVVFPAPLCWVQVFDLADADLVEIDRVDYLGRSYRLGSIEVPEPLTYFWDGRQLSLLVPLEFGIPLVQPHSQSVSGFGLTSYQPGGN